MTTREAAARAGVSPAAVRQWVRRGYLQPVSSGAGGRGRQNLYRAGDAVQAARAARSRRNQAPWPGPLLLLPWPGPADRVTTAQAAQLAGVAPATIRSWVARGKLTPVQQAKPQQFRTRDVLQAVSQQAAARRAAVHAAAVASSPQAPRPAPTIPAPVIPAAEPRKPPA